MKTILSIVLIFCTTYFSAQVSHIFSIGDNDTYSITFSKNGNNYDFDVFKVGENDKKKNFTLPKLDIVTFKNVIFQTLDSLTSPNKIARDDNKINKTIDEIFYTVVSNIDIIDDLNYAPIAGNLETNKIVNLYRDRRYLKPPYSQIKGLKFEITNTQIVFQNGFIQDVIVDGKIIKDADSKIDECIKLKDFENTELRFTNTYGIGLSSKKNIRNLERISLYINQKKNVDKNLLYSKRGDSVDLFKNNEIFIKLGEVIKSYEFKNDLYTNDFSPANIKVSIEGGKSTTLYKDKTYKILEARVFSDFLGFDSNKPNGLIQFELEKQFNFNTTRVKLMTYLFRSGIGFMEYLKLAGGVTKIEDNNRYLIPEMQDIKETSYLGQPILINKRYTTPIDVTNHQVWNIGLTSNIALIDMLLIKSQVHINAGFKFAQTKVQDSLRVLNSDDTVKSTLKEYNLNHWQFFPELVLNVLPETRYGFYASWRPKYLSLLTDGLEYYGALDPLTGARRGNISKWVNEYELLGYLYVNEEKQNGKLFVRWRLNAEMGYRKNNFSQFQLGYSFYVLGRGKQK
ncbi:hypothetical protein HNP38_001161 [Chryseobacterium defluvii]|uniref:Uncharacterized protein n=1 Tax=Chryseobacterium defluvii TaxID=160396 RepID=A0A840K987_9FLAO|nr:hypothetical protein [Chryseobacterium defluvii]MBB4805889.1 hypothetical protein [Chryseobacterium defluvii]